MTSDDAAGAPPPASVQEKELAWALYEALLRYDDEALVEGSPAGGETLIDGNFDLLSVARSVLQRVGSL